MAMKKRILICGILAMMMSSASALEKQVASPDGKLVVTVNDNDGKPSYQVTLDGKVFLETSALGLNTNIGDFTQGMTMSEASEVQAVSDSYQLDRIKKSHVEYHANKQVLTFSKDGKKVYDIIFQVSDNDIAFRYKLYPQGDTRCLVVKQEMMKLYENILIDANDHGIEVIFHGCTLPRGWERMYPNYVASEAVLASENLHFSQGMCDYHLGRHPFHRRLSR